MGGERRQIGHGIDPGKVAGDYQKPDSGAGFPTPDWCFETGR
jgi:hypothetical protein